MSDKKIIPLKEFAPVFYKSDEIPCYVADTIYDKWKKQVDVDYPSRKTNMQWKFVSLGWVGQIPVTQEYAIALVPKVPISNLFLMWEYAYRLKSFFILNGSVECDSIEGFYERIALILANQVLDRSRKGFYRAYLKSTDVFPYVTGEIDLSYKIRKPWDANLKCNYQEHTGDIDDNKILAWTLYIIAHSGMCTDRVLPLIRAAFRSVQGIISVLKVFTAKDCINRLYNRLNQDYWSMHALCRFFLENSGPCLDLGEYTTPPFLVNMAKLYELFVAEWLKMHLANKYVVRAQEQIRIGEEDEMQFSIDIVINDTLTGEVAYIIDTKYKNAEAPSTHDFSQIVTYASIKQCKNAVLVYPTQLSKPLRWTSPEGILVRTIAFDISSDIEHAGEAFIKELIM